jgi:flagellar export protein FliJ
MAFRFHLDPVLRHRKRAEDAAARALAEARRRFEATAGRLEALRERTAASRLALAAAAGHGSTGWDLTERARDVEDLHRRTERCLAELARHRDQVDAARAALMDAAKNRQVLERLEAAARAAHAQRLAKLEQRQTDDIAAAGYLWKTAQADGGEGGAP